MSFLEKHPNLSHSVIAVVLMAILVPILYLAGNPVYAVFAAGLVGTYFYGRESGQNNHDMKNKGASNTKAFWYNIIPIGFTSANWQQFLIPSVVAAVIGFGIQYWMFVLPKIG